MGNLRSVSLLRNRLNQNNSERFAKDFRQSYISVRTLYGRCLLAVKLNTSIYGMTRMIDGNLLQTAHRSFYLNGRVTFWPCSCLSFFATEVTREEVRQITWKEPVEWAFVALSTFPRIAP